MDIQFGTGVLFGAPTSGNLPVTPTPIRLGVLQEVTITYKGDLKKLYGQAQFAVATARGKIEVDLKAKFAAFDPVALNQLFWAQTSTAGIVQIADQENHAIAATVTTTNAAHFAADRGVTNGTTGQTMINVPSSPAVGQYSYVLATGVYSFNSTDVTSGFPVLISYKWNNTTRGTTISLVSQLMGYAPVCAIDVYNSFRGEYIGLTLNAVTLGEMSFPSKIEDFWVSDLSGSANLDPSQTLGYLYLDNA
jgi:hypothetical protein